MSDLTAFRDHAAAMATVVHKPECKWPSRLKVEAHNNQQMRFERLFGEPEGARSRAIHCPGCVTDADRTLWARLAAEIDAYLTTDDTALWEES